MTALEEYVVETLAGRDIAGQRWLFDSRHTEIEAAEERVAALLANLPAWAPEEARVRVRVR